MNITVPDIIPTTSIHPGAGDTSKNHSRNIGGSVESKLTSVARAKGFELEITTVDCSRDNAVAEARARALASISAFFPILCIVQILYQNHFIDRLRISTRSLITASTPEGGKNS